MRARSRPRKAVVLIPLTYNDGRRVPKAKLQAIQHEVFAAFGGWTDEGSVQGAYRMASGKRRVERLKRLAIVLGESLLPRLRAMVARWAAELGQETMLLETTEARVEFVRPLFEEE